MCDDDTCHKTSSNAMSLLHVELNVKATPNLRSPTIESQEKALLIMLMSSISCLLVSSR